MDNIKISIIMPVYKVEKYVAKAIESMQSQTLSEFEFIIVDDGTPDKSGEICDKYAELDERIKVIHKENGGAPSARNVAIDIARGKYLYFLDSDDWAESTMLQDMYEMAEKNQAELVVTGYYIDTYYNQENYISEKIYVDDMVYTDAKSFREVAYKYYDRNMLYTPWNKLYLASVVKENNLKFPNTLWDDFPFNISVLRLVDHITISTNAYYHFIRAREESETSIYRPKLYEKREEEHGWMLQLFEDWNVTNEETQEMLARRYLERVVGCFENLTSSKCTLTSEEKKLQANRILENDRIWAALKIAKPSSAYMKMLLVPIKWKNVSLILLEASVITYVKEHHSKLFAKLKAGR